MRTLALLAALLLLALQAQGEPFPVGDDKAADLEKPGKEDQVTTVIFTGDENSALQDAGVMSGAVCYCRLRCRLLERTSGSCIYRGFVFRFCCR